MGEPPRNPSGRPDNPAPAGGGPGLLSVVIPMYNEESRLEKGVGAILAYLSARHAGSQVLLVDDGSRDATAEAAGALIARFAALRCEVIRLGKNQGKGWAVRQGMLRASGRIRLFADADDATPIEELDRLLPMVDSPRTVVIGSRALDLSKLERRQPWWREGMGRTFNLALRAVLGLPFHDTQCGFKLFGGEAAQLCFPRQRVRRFAFDVELLWIARRLGLPVKEVPVRWRHVPESRVRAVRDSSRMAWDALRIRWIHRNWRISPISRP